jgi:hypothetical protein
MTATYTPCPGTGQPATGVRRMNSAGLGSKYAHLHGKNAGHCPTCDRSFTLGRGVTVTPRHK